jgi:hypothetical protein
LREDEVFSSSIEEKCNEPIGFMAEDSYYDNDLEALKTLILKMEIKRK